MTFPLKNTAINIPKIRMPIVNIFGIFSFIDRPKPSPSDNKPPPITEFTINDENAAAQRPKLNTIFAELPNKDSRFFHLEKSPLGKVDALNRIPKN